MCIRDRFRSGRIGIGDTNPGSPLEIIAEGNPSSATAFFDLRDGRSGYGRITAGADGSSSFLTFTDTDGDMGWQLGADDNDDSWFVVRGFSGSSAASNALSTTFQGNAKVNASLAIYSITGRVFIGKGSGVSTGAGSRLTVGGAIETDNQLKSTVAIGTAPLAVTSTTEVANLNANLLQGYNALGLPYLGASVNVWLSDDGGQERFYFANNSHTYLRTGSDFFFRNNGNSSIGSLNDNGCWTFYSGSDTTQSTYGLEVRQLNGINLNPTESLSSGQKSTVLRASGDKQWIDSYGVFKRNRNSVNENIQVNNGDNCMSAGPITINNGVTVIVNNGGTWSVV